jgi:inorganic pyrophosphatase
MDPQTLQVEVVIEIPRGSFLKRGLSEKVDFITPFPCPFNYGSVNEYIGGDNDLLDALVLGPRLPRGKKVKVLAQGAIGFTDGGIYDDKLICSDGPIGPKSRRFVLIFFHFYAFSKRLLNLFRLRPGATFCNGWGEAEIAIARAKLREDTDRNGPKFPFQQPA